MAMLMTSSTVIPITLWTAQGILATGLTWSGIVKLFQSTEKLSSMWPWAGEVSASLVKFTGTMDLLGAIGLILPELFHIAPILTPIAAIGIIVLMICAGGFHIRRGETSVIVWNIVFAAIAAFIVWGRF